MDRTELEDGALWVQAPAPWGTGAGDLPLGFSGPSFPAPARLLSGLSSLAFSKHLINVMSGGLLIDFYLRLNFLFSALFCKKWF